LPRFEILPSRSLPSVECCLGTKPIHAADYGPTRTFSNLYLGHQCRRHKSHRRARNRGADEDRSSSRRRGAIAPDIVLLKAPMKAETTSLRCWAVKPISRSKSSFGGLFQKPPTITISSVYRSILGSVVGQRRNPTAIRNDHRKPAALP
jgi:hypothetical protein